MFRLSRFFQMFSVLIIMTRQKQIMGMYTRLDTHRLDSDAFIRVVI
jgi:hypothetical protein